MQIFSPHDDPALAFHCSPLGPLTFSPFEVWDVAVNNTPITTQSIQLSPTGAIAALIPGAGLPHSSQEVFVASSVHAQTYATRTCLKRSAESSLSEHVRSGVMKDLCAADAAFTKTETCPVQRDHQLTGYESPQMKRFLREKADDPKAPE